MTKSPNQYPESIYEPELFRMLNLACTLDIEENNPAAWRELFEVAERLK